MDSMALGFFAFAMLCNFEIRIPEHIDRFKVGSFLWTIKHRFETQIASIERKVKRWIAKVGGRKINQVNLTVLNPYITGA